MTPNEQTQRKSAELAGRLAVILDAIPAHHVFGPVRPKDPCGAQFDVNVFGMDYNIVVEMDDPR